MDNIVIIGSSGHASVIGDIVEAQGECRIVGVLDERRDVEAMPIGHPVLGNEDDLPRLVTAHGLSGGIIAVGDNFRRAQIAAKVRSVCPEFTFLTAVHPRATVARNVLIGAGTVVMAGATINPGCSIGCHCILNTGSSLDHDSVVEDFASLAPGATTGGNVRLGSFAAISIGATIIQNLHIGEHAVIGAGATVLTNIEAYKTAYGTPAREMGTRKAGDKYL